MGSCKMTQTSGHQANKHLPSVFDLQNLLTLLAILHSFEVLLKSSKDTWNQQLNHDLYTYTLLLDDFRFVNTLIFKCNYISAVLPKPKTHNCSLSI